MRELTYEEFCEMPMQMVYHFSMERKFIVLRANKETDVSMMVVSPNTYNGYKGKVKTSYAFDGKTYKTSDAVYMAYMEKVCGVTL